MHRRVLFIVVLFTFTIPACSQTNRIESIKSDGRYITGEGRGTDIDMADREAIRIICSQMFTAMLSTYKEESKIDTKTGLDESKQEFITHSYTSAALTNAERIDVYEKPNDACVFRYMLKTEVAKIFKARVNKITDYIAQGIRTEEQGQIADALRYYTWALMLLKSYPGGQDLRVAIGERGQDNGMIWLHSKISDVFSKLKINITNMENIGENTGCYNITAQISYLNKPVSNLDFDYFDGTRYIGPNHIMNGTALLEFEHKPTDAIKIKFDYKFEDQAESFDDELAGVYNSLKVPDFPNSKVTIPIESKVGSKAINSFAINRTESQRVKEEYFSDNIIYKDNLDKIRTALQNKDLSSVRNLFTDDGYNLFTKMFENKTYSLLPKNGYAIIKNGGQVIGKYLPVKFKYEHGNKSFGENVVFRFDDNKKITSVAFGLTKIAEDDIFDSNRKWDIDSRYKLLNFMEDYQTAYSLKRIDYLRSIFSDNAIIIVGSVCKDTGIRQRWTDSDVKRNIDRNNPRISYSRLSKEEYINNLANLFRSKEYVKLTFEDNETQKISVTGSNREAYAIQIKQYYYTNRYSDQGYLTLLIDMDVNAPEIRVRVWRPSKADKMSLDEFLSRITTE